MTVEQERMVVVLEARLDKLEKGFARARASGTSAIDRIVFDANKMERTLSRVNVGNITAQLQDVGVQLAGGQSPFLIAIQQGTQLTAALGPGGLGSALKALGTGFLSLLNPVGLLTVGLIGLTGYAVQYFTEMVSSGEVSNETLKEQAQLIERVAQRWGDQIPVVAQLAAELKRAADEQERLAAKQILTAKALEPTRAQTPDLQSRMANAIRDLSVSGVDTARIAEIQRAFEQLFARIEDGKIQTADLEAVQRLLNAAYEETPVQPIQDLLATLEGFAPTLAKSADGVADINAQLGIVTLTGIDAKDATAALVSQLIGLGPTGSTAVEQVTSSILDGLIPALGSAGQLVANLFANVKSMQAQVANGNLLGTLSPLTSNDGKFMNPAEQQEWTAANTKSQTQIAAEKAAKSGSRKKAISEAERERKAVLDLIDALEFERSLIGLTDVEREKANALRRAGSAATDEQRAKIEQLVEASYREREAHEAAEEAIQRQKEAMEDLGNIGLDAVQSIADALADGKITTEEWVQILSRLVDQLLSMPNLGSILGGGSGGFGGILGALFGGGSSDPWAGLRLAGGGSVSGPGTSRSDSIPAMLSDGEFVVNARSAKQYRSLLERINSGQSLALADGGLVGAMPSLPKFQDMAGSSPGSTSLTLQIDARGTQGNQEIEEAINRGVRRGIGRLMQDKNAAKAITAQGFSQMRTMGTPR